MKEVDIAKDGGKLKYTHVDTNHADNPKMFNERLNIKLPIIVLMSGKLHQRTSSFYALKCSSISYILIVWYIQKDHSVFNITEFADKHYSSYYPDHLLVVVFLQAYQSIGILSPTSLCVS